MPKYQDKFHVPVKGVIGQFLADYIGYSNCLHADLSIEI